MELKHQLTSPELSKRLSELGVRQESYFYHIKTDINDYQTIKHFQDNARNSFVSNYGNIVEEYSAFSVAELGEMLPAYVEVEGYSFFKEKGIGYLTLQKHTQWKILYIIYRDGIPYVLGGYDDIKTNKKGGTFFADTEADARAKMLIYLLENKLIKK